MREDELRARVGHRFPGGRMRVEPDVDRLVRGLVGAPPSECGVLHPTVALLVAQDGLGVELEELFALFGSSSAEGPVLGEWAVEFARPLRAGVEYHVRAVVEDARRRSGRSGPFDLVTVLIELCGPDGAVHAEVRPGYVFRRPG
ncbi:thioesterase family protein [Pseudonocardia lacus]|uniref:thioesterase family protein n=1 Tax=Pseudonocardia lacus TaxID=2835865 RepID=UPI001BDC16CB|nr:thioesterase family protein [Pseudonocardia lacus]